MNSWKITGIVAVAVLLSAATGIGFGSERKKKLVNFGWDMKSPADLAKDIDQLQDLPFDGLTIRAAWCYPFYSTGLGTADATVEIAKKIKWGRFTANFMYMTAAKKVDWFDDKLWADDGEIMKNIRALARIGAAAGCKGIMFEPEFVYWGQTGGPWEYALQDQKSTYTFAQFEAKVRQRGAAVINAIEEYMPDTAFLTCFWGGGDMYSETEGIYGLLNAFMCGILDGADAGTRVIHGNESGTYYINTREAFENVRRTTKEDNLAIIPKGLRDKYRRQVQSGAAIYADHLSNTRPVHVTSTYMTPAERAKCMEHNVYWALRTSDHYVWFYTEVPQYLRHKGIAPEMIPAINRARRKIALGEPLGFDVDDIQKRAWRDYLAAEHAPVPTETANIPSTVSPPTIDGNLNDAAWSSAAVLGPFLNYATAVRKELYAATEARMTFDADTLYIAFQCQDPKVKAVVVPNFTENHLFWTGGAVEITIATSPENRAYYHIKIGSDNTRWDSLTDAGFDIYGKDSSWTGEYESAVHKGRDAWTVEIAIPWRTIGRQAREPGDRIKGNLERRARRWPDGVQELSSWSQRRTIRCPEAEQFGTWIFE